MNDAPKIGLWNFVIGLYRGSFAKHFVLLAAAALFAVPHMPAYLTYAGVGIGTWMVFWDSMRIIRKTLQGPPGDLFLISFLVQVFGWSLITHFAPSSGWTGFWWYFGGWLVSILISAVYIGWSIVAARDRAS